MKWHYFSKQFLLCIFLLGNLISAQNQVDQNVSNGLSTTVFNLDEGKITVYIPEFLNNESFSGTIRLESFGNTANKKRKNLERLISHSLLIDGQNISLDQGIFQLTPRTASHQISLLNGKGRSVASSNLDFSKTNDPNRTNIFIPNYLVLGNVARIIGPTDGIIGNSSLTINNENIQILAESQTASYFLPTNIPIGRSSVRYTNNGEVTAAKCNVLQLDLSVGDADLLSGQQTNLNISVSGLDGLDEEIPINIRNNSIQNIALEGGNNQELIVTPSGNTFAHTIRISAIRRGGFSISVNALPDQPTTNPNDDILCACLLNDNTHLLSPQACEELGGKCDELPSEDIDDLEDENPPDISIVFPSEVNQNNTITLSVNDHRNECLVTVFWYKRINEQEWQFLGRDDEFQNGFSIEWKPDASLSGLVQIRVETVNRANVIAEKTANIWVVENGFNIDNELAQFVNFTITQDDIDREWEKAKAIGERIKEEEEKKRGLEDDIWDEIESKEKNEAERNKLIAIDSIIERIPSVYKDSLHVLVDSLNNLRRQLPNIIDKTALQNAVDDAQKRVDHCQEHLEKLKEEKERLEKERDRLKQETDSALEQMDALMKSYGLTGGYGYHPDGRYWYGYIGDENSKSGVSFTEEYAALKKTLRGLKKEYLKTLRRLDELPLAIADAQENCDELNEALEKAKEAVKNADLHAATEIAIDDICRQIRSLLKPLWRWCLANPDHCAFKEELRKMLEECPKSIAELESFWEQLGDLIKQKKEKEDEFEKAAKNDQDEIEGLEDKIKEIEDRIKALKEAQAKAYAEAENKRQQRLKELAEAKARAEAKKKERAKQKKADDKIKELIKKAKSEEAGDKAFQDLMKGLGLDLLDEASGNLKLGKIIGGLLVIKNMPDCVCEMLSALQMAFKAARDGPEGPAAYVEAYLLAWKKCANLPSISSVSIGGSELTKAINRMSKAELDRALKALNQALRVQCK